MRASSGLVTYLLVALRAFDERHVCLYRFVALRPVSVIRATTRGPSGLGDIGLDHLRGIDNAVKLFCRDIPEPQCRFL